MKEPGKRHIDYCALRLTDGYSQNGKLISAANPSQEGIILGDSLISAIDRHIE